MANEDAAIDKLSLLMDKLVDFSIHAGEKIVVAIIVFIVGKLVIKLINKLLRRILSRKEVDEGVKTFLYSLTNILLTILLVVSVIGALGVNTASFAALLSRIRWVILSRCRMSVALSMLSRYSTLSSSLLTTRSSMSLMALSAVAL